MNPADIPTWSAPTLERSETEQWEADRRLRYSDPEQDTDDIATPEGF